MNRSLSLWHINVAGIAAILLLTAATWFVGVRPVLNRRDNAMAVQQAYITAHQKLRDTDNDVASLTSQLQIARQDRSAHGQRLEPVTHLNRRLASLTELATSAGATLDDVQPGKSIPSARFDVMPIHLAGTGTYSQFTALLHAIREQHGDLGVGALVVSGTPATANLPATFTIDLSWYTQPRANKAAGK
jgi:Tfp pilus assembly protein PilO